MRVGASGLLGTELRGALWAAGHQWVGFSRKQSEREGEWRKLEDGFEGLDAVVNLAGESIAQVWNEENKKKFYDSRVGVTEQVVGLFGVLEKEKRPKILLNASAVGFYGSQGRDWLTEESPAGQDYLAVLCKEWETAAEKAENLGVRVVRGRIGVVFASQAEAWKRMRTVFKLGIGGKLGDGKQFWPCVHAEDVAGAIVHCLEKEAISGAVNLTGADVVDNAAFTKIVAKSLGRPSFLPVPEFGLKMVMGGFAEALLASYRVRAGVLEETGYEFRHESTRELVGNL